MIVFDTLKKVFSLKHRSATTENVNRIKTLSNAIVPTGVWNAKKAVDLESGIKNIIELTTKERNKGIALPVLMYKFLLATLIFLSME